MRSGTLWRNSIAEKRVAVPCTATDESPMIGGLIFDLDGVIVDTSEFHYQAWKRLAAELGIAFTRDDNEKLKGLSRLESLDTILSLANPYNHQTGVAAQSRKIELAKRKNSWYLEFVRNLAPDDILPGVENFLVECRQSGIKTAIASSSKNAKAVIDSLAISHLFDCIVDGTRVAKAKPNPQIFLIAVKKLNEKPGSCIILEDALAGVEAARLARIRCIGIAPEPALLPADLVIPGFLNFGIKELCSFDRLIRNPA